MDAKCTLLLLSEPESWIKKKTTAGKTEVIESAYIKHLSIPKKYKLILPHPVEHLQFIETLKEGLSLYPVQMLESSV